MARIRSVPGARAMERTYAQHPKVTAWALLGAAMVLLMSAFSAGVGLTSRQWLALAVATAITAGLSVWIVFAEAGEQGR